MKIYKISQPNTPIYDTYDSAIVIAESEDDARNMTPDGEDWVGTWCEPDRVTVELIGEALPDAKKGIVLASFNAG